MSGIIIAIDGPAASGKSTLSRALALQLNFLHVDSGAFYRAVTWAMVENKVDLSWEGAVKEALRVIGFAVAVKANHVDVSIQGRFLNEELREAQVNSQVSNVASLPEVRNLVTHQLRLLGSGQSCVIEGRDIGSVVFPTTPYKLYLDAPLHIRAVRRESQGTPDCIASRDRADTQRITAPLRASADAIHVDVGDKNPAAVVEFALHALRSRGFSMPSATLAN